jgi:heme exporter protein B
MIFNIFFSTYKLFIQYLIFNFKENTILLSLSFYILILILFAFSIDIHLLNVIAFNVIYIICLLTYIFSIENIFQKDYDDDTLILLYLIIIPIEILILIKIIIHWLNYGLSLILLSPIILLILNIYIFNMILIIGYGTIYLSVWAAFCGALTLKLKQKFLINILIITPILIPIHIFSNKLNEITMLHIIISLNLLLFYGIINIFISTNLLKMILNSTK